MTRGATVTVTLVLAALLVAAVAIPVHAQVRVEVGIQLPAPRPSWSSRGLLSTMRRTLQRTSSSTPMSTGSSPTADGMSGRHGTVHGRSSNLSTSRHPFFRSLSATTRCPLRTGASGVVMGRRGGRRATDGSGTKKSTSVNGVNARSAGIGAREEAASPDSPSKEGASVGPPGSQLRIRLPLTSARTSMSSSPDFSVARSGLQPGQSRCTNSLLRL